MYNFRILFKGIFYENTFRNFYDKKEITIYFFDRPFFNIFLFIFLIKMLLTLFKNILLTNDLRSLLIRSIN